jgi:hypothetical protein
MFAPLKRRVVLGIVHRCVTAARSNSVSVRFVDATSLDALRDLARNSDVYVLTSAGVVRHYFYSEPGNPFLSESYTCLADFIYSIIIPAARPKYTEAALVIASAPHTCPDPDIREYAQLHRSTSQGEFLGIVLEVEKMVAKLTFLRVDSILMTARARYAQWLAFPLSSSSDPAGSHSVLHGEWITHSEKRNYGGTWFDARFEMHDGTWSAEKERNLEIRAEFGGMIAVQVMPQEGVPWEERLIVSPDGRNLVVHESGGRKLFWRPSVPGALAMDSMTADPVAESRRAHCSELDGATYMFETQALATVLKVPRAIGVKFHAQAA